MKRFFWAVALCISLLFTGLFFLMPATEAQTSVLPALLNLPAPPPPNPLYKPSLKQRDEAFYSKKTPPKDDAPIADLLEYWERQSSGYQELGYNIKPSKKTLDRITAEIEKNPDTLPNFLNVLPETSEMTDFVKRLYDASKADPDAENWERERIKRWLSMKSDYFSDELLKTAEQVKDVNEYVGNQEELLALTRVNFEKARPILERLYNDPTQRVSQVLARWAFYRRALDTNSFGDISRYRDELKAVVEDKSATAGMRDLAFDALVKEADWEGRDDWYFTLLEDETLADLQVNGTSYTGLTTLVLYSDPDKYADKMLELLKSSNQTVRSAAIRNLARILDKDHPEVIKALLPWLENPNWAKEISGERRRLVEALQNLEMPESVPGLIAMLEEKQLQEVYTETGAEMGNTMSNVMRSSSNMANIAGAVSPGTKSMVEYSPYRYAAVEALATQKDIRSVNALRRVLPEVQDYERVMVVKAIFLSGGFSIPEQLEAIELHAQGVKEEIKEEAIRQAAMEAIAKESEGEIRTDAPIAIETRRLEVRTVDAANTASNVRVVRPFNASEIKPILGIQIAANPEPSAEFLRALIDRISVLDRKDAQTAQALRRIMKNWRGAAVNALLLNDLKNNKLEIESIIKLLGVRKELREKQAGDIFGARGGGSAVAFGITACLLEDNSEYDAILAGENAEAKTALLGCARLIRAPLPVRKVAENLQSQNKLLALAAENYLEAEDSPEARQIVLSLHPDKAQILGATTFFGNKNSLSVGGDFITELFASVGTPVINNSYYYLVVASSEQTELEATEKKLQKEVLENRELLGVYAYDDNFIRIYTDKAVFSWEEDPARYRERVLQPEEFDNFKAFLASQNVDELVPFLGTCEECGAKELLMLGRSGGRRVYVRADPLPDFFAELEKLFEDMRRPPAKLHYYLEKDIAGIEILFADDNLEAKTLWKNGADFRLLIANPERREQLEKELLELAQMEETDEMNYLDREKMFRKRREQALPQHLAWFKFADGKAFDLAGQPPLIDYPPLSDGAAIPATEQQWKARAANIEIRANEEGLYKKSGAQFTKISDGYYDKPIVSPNGRWAVALKYDEKRELVRVNLQTGKEFKINTGDIPICQPSAFLPAVNKALIVCGNYQNYYHDEEPEEEPQVSGDFYLLDAETGTFEKAKGDFRPLGQQTFRPLQPTGKTDEFWAAIPDKDKNETQFGLYNARTFSFKPTLRIPQIKVDSMNVWVDAGEGKIYIVYEGQMLSVPLKK